VASFAHFLSLYIGGFAILSLAIISIIFCRRAATKGSYTLASGVLLIAIGSLVQILSSFASAAFDEAGKLATAPAIRSTRKLRI